MVHRIPVRPRGLQFRQNPLSALVRATALASGAAMLTKTGRAAGTEFLNGTPISQVLREIVGPRLNELLSSGPAQQVDRFGQNLAELLRADLNLEAPASEADSAVRS